METSPSGNRTFYTIGLSILLSAAITSGIVYAVQKKQGDAARTDLQTQINGLKSQIAALPTPEPTADWKTYANTQYKYSIKYPSTWVYSEYPEPAATGAVFRLSTTPSDSADQFLQVDYMVRATQYAGLPLDQFLSKEGADIQNVGENVSMDKVTTDSGIVGYKTTWKVTSREGKTTTSNPITYFPTADGNTTGMIVLMPEDLIEALPYSADYTKVISSFKFTD